MSYGRILIMNRLDSYIKGSKTYKKDKPCLDCNTNEFNVISDYCSYCRKNKRAKKTKNKTKTNTVKIFLNNRIRVTRYDTFSLIFSDPVKATYKNSTNSKITLRIKANTWKEAKEESLRIYKEVANLQRQHPLSYKLINPATKLPFHKGDICNDGSIFDSFYSYFTLKDFMQKRDYLGKKTINPKTGCYYESGDIREDGMEFRFWREIITRNKEKKLIPEWIHPERKILDEEKRKSFPAWRIRKLISSSKRRSEKKGYKFNLNDEWFKEKLKDQDNKCLLTDIKFDFGTGSNEYHRNPFAPSIDRIDSSLGYVKSNCRIVISFINIAINEYPDDLFTRVSINYLIKKFKNKNDLYSHLKKTMNESSD